MLLENPPVPPLVPNGPDGDKDDQGVETTPVLLTKTLY
jgi:hypothetical protein